MRNYHLVLSTSLHVSTLLSSMHLEYLHWAVFVLNCLKYTFQVQNYGTAKRVYVTHASLTH